MHYSRNTKFLLDVDNKKLKDPPSISNTLYSFSSKSRDAVLFLSLQAPPKNYIGIFGSRCYMVAVWSKPLSSGG